MNNYDRIKSMDVEEMAEALDLLRTCDCGISSYNSCKVCIINGLCQTSNIKQWLLSEVEDE